ncbi:aconitate hydratase [Halorubrum laminariae]|uniref:Aconitate hydratase n=1 Tax=Halorubrum laminariae TaxID=1433523 RepID=A0ABD6C135_9EURY|nr:aconitate hydratase [Halorubrum laminariae]
MGQSLTEKILSEHLVDGKLEPGEEIGIEIDQTIAHDLTGTMVWLQFEALDLDEVRVDVAGQHCDHQTYQPDFKVTDDHRFLRSAAGTYGAYFARPGTGILHQVHKENYTTPGTTLLGADSHTPTAGGLGAIGIGTGGLDVATAMGGAPYYIEMPEVVNVRLEGKLPPWTTAKDVILELLRRLSVKGGIDKVFEYTGPGVETLSANERTVISNMGTELGATTSVFPTDERTRDYLARLGREDDYRKLGPDPDAEYDEQIVIDLSDLDPLVACPSMPDNVVPVREVVGTTVDQVIVGSCTNGAYEDLLPITELLSNREVASGTETIVQPGSKQAAEMLSREGRTADLLAAGVNFSEATCGACIGAGHVPASDSVSLRTFNRNFEGRSGNEEDDVYLCSPEVAAVSALSGELVDPRDAAAEFDLDPPGRVLPDSYIGTSEADLIQPDGAIDDELVKGPNFGAVPLKDSLESTVSGPVLLKVPDNITTDHIIPGTKEVSMYRSNVPKLSEYTLSRVDEEFADRAASAGSGFIVAGENYGQGSSREHAALCPMYLGVDGVLAKSFARIHRTNLINFGLLPLVIDDTTYDRLDESDEVTLVEDVVSAVEMGQTELTIRVNDNWEAPVTLHANERERTLLIEGGKLPHTKRRLSS